MRVDGDDLAADVVGVECRGCRRGGRGSLSFSLNPRRVMGARVIFYEKYFKDVSRELDEFRVNTHISKLRCWYL